MILFSEEISTLMSQMSGKVVDGGEYVTVVGGSTIITDEHMKIKQVRCHSIIGNTKMSLNYREY